MIDFTNRPALYNAAGPMGAPPEHERRGLVLNTEVMVGHRGHVARARVRGFCTFVKFGACFNYTLQERQAWWPDDDMSTSLWCPLDEEGIGWCHEAADEETKAAMLAAAAMC